MIITILTPTYNRARNITTLWKSLKSQTDKNFEWLVVDDGSTDNTENVIEQLKSKSNFIIRYLYKENGGKHTALNMGIKMIDSELTFIVDSDDFVTEDAIESILKIHEKYKRQNNICGYAFLRSFPNGEINGKKFDVDEKIGSYIDVRVNRNDTNADKAEVFKTQCLKEFPFPEYQNEKFLGEDLIWIRMARKYEMVHINKVIYIGNYQDDGLTKNRRRNNIRSPIGCMNRAREFMGPEFKKKYRIKATLQYIIYGKFAGISIVEILKTTPDRGLTLICLIPGLILQKSWKRKFCSNR